MNSVKWIVSLMVISLGLMLASCGEPADTEDQPEAPGVTANPDFGDELDRSERIATVADLSAFEDNRERELNETFTLTIADTLFLELNVQNKSNPLRDLISYSGSVTGDGAGDFTLSQDGSMFLGTIRIYEDNLRFQITYDRVEGQHKLYRLKHDQIEEMDILD